MWRYPQKPWGGGEKMGTWSNERYSIIKGGAAVSRKFRITLIALTLVAALVAFSGLAMAEGHGKGGAKAESEAEFEFEDMHGHWAEPAVMQMYLQGIVSGEDAMHFGPNKPVTRADAAIMIVKITGWQTDAEDMDEQEVQGFRGKMHDLEEAPAAARAYLAMANQLQIIQGDGKFVNPNKPLTRMEAAALLLRAQGYTLQDAQAYANAQLTFKDAKAIPAWAVPWVAMALDKGLLHGYTDNTFRPKQPVTRAEFVQMLANNQLQFRHSMKAKEGLYERTVVVGTVKATGSTSITVTTGSGDQEIPLASQYAVFFGKATGSLADLQVGDVVRVMLNADGQAVVIYVRMEGEDVTGTVTAITDTSITITPNAKNGDQEEEDEVTLPNTPAGEPVTFTFASNVAVKIDGKEATVADIKVGDKVEVQVLRGVAYEIKVESEGNDENGENENSGEVDGVIQTITADTNGFSITLAGQDGQAGPTYEVSADVKVKAGDTEIAFTDLKPGDRVKLELEQNVVVKIEVLASPSGS